MADLYFENQTQIDLQANSKSLDFTMIPPNSFELKVFDDEIDIEITLSKATSKTQMPLNKSSFKYENVKFSVIRFQNNLDTDVTIHVFHD